MSHGPDNSTVNSKKRLAVFSIFPAQNMRTWFDFLRRHSHKYHVTYICPDFSRFGLRAEDYPAMRIVEYGKPGTGWKKKVPSRILMWFRFLRIKRELNASGPFDLLMLHGLYKPEMCLKVLDICQAFKKVLFIWNTTNYLCENSKNTADSGVLSSVFTMVDGIYFGQNPNMNRFVSVWPRYASKAQKHTWGLPSEFCDLSLSSATPLSEELLSRVEDEEILVFWARSINVRNRHDLLLETLKLASATWPEHIWARTRFILITGVGADARTMKILKAFEKAQFSNVHISHGEYFQKEWLMPFYDRADIWLNLSDTDQMTSGFYEACARKARVIMSDIVEYQHLPSMGFRVDLVKNDAAVVSEVLRKRVEEALSGEPSRDMDVNREIIQRDFNADINLEKIIQSAI
ncbi:hypothetical protein CSA37_07540 [Candidatus Fermentibacteria bacterium]|nr:MAG: hypothetical protein CSA37_07540 [Candidatus Fermentibacteria bacterium]